MKKLVVALVTANLLLFGAHLSSERATLQAQETDLSPKGWADCCRRSTGDLGYCCDNCCWWDRCDSSTECEPQTPDDA